jgi:hypothetical protein
VSRGGWIPCAACRDGPANRASRHALRPMSSRRFVFL